MNVGLGKIVHYWRLSLADGALGTGTFRQRDLSRLITVSGAELRTGLVSRQLVAKLFEGRGDDEAFVSVRFWPLVTRRKGMHAAIVSDGMPDVVVPIITDASVDRNGKILPSRNVVARDVLSPLAEGTFSIGTVDDLDAFLATSPFLPEEDGSDWSRYLGHCRRMIDAVANGWPSGDDDYVPAGIGLMQVSADSSATVRQILDLYDTLLKEGPELPLLSRYVTPQQETAPSPGELLESFGRRLGHSNDRFPLAEQQRQVLAHLASLPPGDVVAVNGPPGTGKTTMLLSAVASEWIRAALEEGDPPIIVAASSNNQAVTNIIDAFGRDFAPGDGPFAGRWLPGIESFGVFLASTRRKADAAEVYQTEDFFLQIETGDYVAEAKQAYLKAASAAFPALAPTDVRQVVAMLHDRMKAEAGKLTATDAARQAVRHGLSVVEEELGKTPKSALADLAASRDRFAALETSKRDRVRIWERYLAQESPLLALFAFLPAISRKRALRARLFLEDAGYSLDPGAPTKIDAIDRWLRSDLRETSQARAMAEARLQRAENVRAGLARAENDWSIAVAAFGVDALPISEAKELDRLVDCRTRFQLFLLATHYWEGRWLLDMEEGLPDIEVSRGKTGRTTVIPRWRRRMMLTPCAVSTFASLPGKMACSRYSDGDFKRDYLLNFIDLLIVDEAGQVLPEVAGASFALAKRALVIGDTQQIEPISSVPKAVDIGNLLETGLLPRDFAEDDLKALSARGLRTSDGSAMRMAQETCRQHPYPELERGLYLFEHRRCFDEIISYCNALCYKGTLQPKRGKAPAAAPLPALGYLHVDGIAFASGGSRRNPTEARTIAAWLEANRKALESRYDQALERIVGVVTPFGRQVREIREACAARGIRVGGRDGMTIGTVHALQGAERPVVIFSPVYSKHADGPFIDRSPSMLNVTVSRAKDSFLVFGDMDVFSAAASGTPRALLARFLFASPGNTLAFTTEPRDDLRLLPEQLSMLHDAAEHDAFLLDALAGTARTYMIVSPWIVVPTMEKTGILSALRAAIGRGAEIEVFVDSALNEATNAEGVTNLKAAEAALSEIGVTLRRVRQIHSKIVAADNELLSVGSFNWLSASRIDKFARHETSFVYRGPHLKHEIETIMASLRQRERTVRS